MATRRCDAPNWWRSLRLFMAPGAPDSLAAPIISESLLLDLLVVLLTGVNVLRPVYGPTGEIEDFAMEYLNPTGQRMSGLSEQYIRCVT